MALPNISTVFTDGNLGRVTLGNDAITGLVFYGTKPAEYGTDDQKQLFSIAEAENLGITVDSYPVEHYQISETFRVANASIPLVVRFQALPGSGGYTFTEMETMQNEADGELRVIGVFISDADVSSPLVSLLQAQADVLKAQNTPAFFVLAANVPDYSALPSFAAADYKDVAVVISGSGNGTGYDLYLNEGYSVCALGALLGSFAKLPVSEGVQYVAKFSQLAGSELDTVIFGDGTPLKSLTRTALSVVTDKHYIILMKHSGTPGTYWGIGYSCQGSGDYSEVRLSRTAHKAQREVTKALTPKIGAPIKLTDGKIDESTASTFESIAKRPLQLMQNANEISAHRVFINRNQDVLGTDKLAVQISIVPYGASNFIEQTIGYAVTV
jgi:hypothetical protein